MTPEQKQFLADLGRKGGKKTLKKLGFEHFQRISKLGVRARQKKAKEKSIKGLTNRIKGV